MVWPQASTQPEGQAAPRCPQFLHEALGAPHAVLGQSSGMSVPPPSCTSPSGGEADALGTLRVWGTLCCAFTDPTRGPWTSHVIGSSAQVFFLESTLLIC